MGTMASLQYGMGFGTRKVILKTFTWTEERSKCAWCIVDNYSKIQE